MNMLSSKILLNFVLISDLVPTVYTNNQPHSFMQQYNHIQSGHWLS